MQAASVPSGAVLTPPAIALPSTVLTALASVRAGALNTALAQLTRLARKHRDERDVHASVVAALVEVRLARGELAEALTCLGSVTDDELAPTPMARLLVARGTVAMACNDADAAIAHFEAAGVLDVGFCDVDWRSGLALAMLAAGRRREAADVAGTQVSLARAACTPYAIATALRTQATTDLTGRRLELLEGARLALIETTAERLVAQIDVDIAGMLLLDQGAGAAGRAISLLRGAEQYAGRHELRPLLDRAQRMLRLLGEAPAEVTSDAVASLTAAERRVAELGAEGLSNRQIAARLEVGVKAVEWHLSHAYRKLGISSRTRLRVALGAK